MCNFEIFVLEIKVEFNPYKQSISLNSLNLEGNVSEIMNKNFKYVLENYKEKDIVSLMNKYNIRQIPVLDKSGRIADLKCPISLS